MHRGQSAVRQSLNDWKYTLSRYGRNPRSRAAYATLPQKILTSILIANRGEIALRVGKTAALYGIKTTTIYTDPDAKSQHALSSPYAINLGHSSAYLDGDNIIAVAKDNGCVGIHPGYGFLSENSVFARKCAEAGLVFIGPPWEAMEAMGNKSRSKEIMTKAGVPCVPGYHGSDQGPEVLEAEAEQIGFPVMLKAVKGGGGKGMRIALTSDVFQQQLESAKSEATSSFGDDTMLVEKYISTPRHIEVQIFADKHGNCVALGERDCSIQRRHQKVLEESPAPNLDQSVRQDLWTKARAAALAVGYEGAGTVEFIFDTDTGKAFFMEMNTRLQVEHPVTEMVTGEDLVRWQIMVAEGQPLPLTQPDIEQKIGQMGHAIEARIYAEKPAMDFIPDSGVLAHLAIPPTSDTVRVDAGFVEGDVISAHYDPMIAKLIVRGPTREVAVRKLQNALEQYQVGGVVTNIEFLKRVCNNQVFLAGNVETGFISKQKESLFSENYVSDETYAQAALASLFSDASQNHAAPDLVTCLQSGFGSNLQHRRFGFVVSTKDGLTAGNQVLVDVRAVGPHLFDIDVGKRPFQSVASEWKPSLQTITSYFPSRRIDSKIYDGNGRLTIFQQGQQFHLQRLKPAWLEKALGVKDTTHSVLAPMPCRILRVVAHSGEEVEKNQPLIIIESMKMETIIRSPQQGIISRIVHQAGDICKAGTALVEFEEAPN